MRAVGPAFPWCMTSPRKFSPSFIWRWKGQEEHDLVLRRYDFHPDILHSHTAVQACTPGFVPSFLTHCLYLLRISDWKAAVWRDGAGAEQPVRWGGEAGKPVIYWRLSGLPHSLHRLPVYGDSLWKGRPHSNCALILSNPKYWFWVLISNVLGGPSYLYYFILVLIYIFSKNTPRKDI